MSHQESKKLQAVFSGTIDPVIHEDPDMISDSESEQEYNVFVEDDEDGDQVALENKMRTNPFAWGQIPEEIEKLRRERHDIVHRRICEVRGFEFGEKPLSNYFQIEDQGFDIIKNQTPDIVMIEESEIKLIDVTISSSHLSSMIKKGKYENARKIIERNTNKKTTVHCVRLDPNTYDLEAPSNLITEDELYDVLESIEKITNRIDVLSQTEEGKRWLINSRSENRLNNPFQFSKDLVTDQFERFERKPFHNKLDLNDVLEGKLTLPNEDQFIDHCLDEFDPTSSKLTNSHSANIQKFWDFHTSMSEGLINDPLYVDNNRKFRSYLPLPNVDGMLVRVDRNTENDDQDITSVLSLMKSSLDEYCRILGQRSIDVPTDKAAKLKINNNFRCYRHCYFTTEERSRIALEGPGRKRFSLTSKAHQNRSLKDKNYWAHPDLPTDDILNLSFRYSKIDNPSDHPSKWTGPGLDYLRFCQDVYQEININCLRKATNKCHIIKPTSYKGIFIIIHPGPLLKSGDTSSIIWFKLIAVPVDVEITIDVHEENKHWKSWNHRDKVWSSRWLSTDSNRLDHYIRCYDKIIMSYSSYCSTPEKSMVNYIKGDRSNTLGLMILIYLEDKRSTSKMLQDIRYIFMMKMSVYDHSGRTLDRFKVPLRTPLQLYLLKKITDYISKSFKQVVKKLMFGKIREFRTSTKINDKYSGANVMLDRIVTDGPPHSFDQMLHETYFCMLFNKNQDNATHASFQILTKMLEGEESLEQVKAKTKLYMGHDKSPLEDASYLINNDHRNQFSRSAIILGSVMQSQSRSTAGYSGETAYLYASTHSSLNKTVNEYATFKSSSMTERLYYQEVVDQSDESEQKKDEEELYYDGHDIRDTGEEILITKKVQRQNRRRRCIQGVMELMKNNMYCAFDVIKNHHKDPEIFQVFKKNQIGGVREILILGIEDRIMINVIETFSRLICARDSREMLTHGPSKNHRFQSMLRNIRAKDPLGKIFHLNFDKSKWGPSFQPIQFLYIFYPFKHIFPDLFNYFTALLIKHTNKRVLLPERLIRAWVRDPGNIMKHNMDKNLQREKERFLKDKGLTVVNESNMGQGILHFTSSLLHLCLISFRDKLMRRWMSRKGLQGVYWDDILSSDDSYTCLNIGKDNSSKVKDILDGFLHCQEISERLFNCETSLSKSSISNIFCEFNSLFGVNLSLHPTRLKFALSTMDVFYTDSFVRMVKESFNVCRALFENGGQLDLFKLAHELNKDFCENLYAVNRENNPSQILGVEKFPYQLGYYPVYEPMMMLIFGPEMHNMKILEDGLTDRERMIFNASHTLCAENLHSILEFDMNSDSYVGIRVIETKIKPSRLINVIRRISPMTKDRIRSLIESDPLLLLRRPRSNEEIKLKVSMKLFQNSSAEAARSVNPAFFVGRLSASRTARCFVVQGVKSKMMTYKEALLSLASITTTTDSRRLYPSLNKYKDAREQMYRTTPDLVKRDILEIKRFHKLVLQENDFHLKNSLVDILNHMWVTRTSDNSLERDSRTLMEKFPFMCDHRNGGIKRTISNLTNEEEDDGLSKLLLIIMRILGDNYRPMKVINYGHDSTEIIRSVYSMNSSNMSESVVGLIDLTSETESISLTKFETVKLHLNMCSMFLSQGKIEDGLKILGKLKFRDIEGMMKNPYVDPKAKQLCFMYLLKTDMYEEALKLVRSSEFIVSKYIEEQKKDENGNYFGPGVVMIQSGDIVLQFDSRPSGCAKVNKLDLKVVSRLLKESYRMLGISKTFHHVDPNYHYEKDQIHPGKGNIKIVIDPKMDYIRFVPGQIKVSENRATLKDKITKKNIMNIKDYFLPTESRHWDDDFPATFKGCLVKNLIGMGFFSTYFALEDLSRSKSLDTIVEMNYETPEISKSTKENLNIEVDDSEEKDYNEEFEESFDFGEEIEMDLGEENIANILESMESEGIQLIQTEENNLMPVNNDVVERMEETNQMWWEDGNIFDFGSYIPRPERKESIGQIMLDRLNHAGELLLIHSIYNISELSKLHLQDIYRFSAAREFPSLLNALLFTYEYLYGGLTVRYAEGRRLGCLSYLTTKFLTKIGMPDSSVKMRIKVKGSK